MDEASATPHEQREVFAVEGKGAVQQLSGDIGTQFTHSKSLRLNHDQGD
jgi:hypothetical protein